MCGIIGYVGSKKDPMVGLEALKRLEYRGYDSAGMAYYDPKTQTISAHKATGRVSALEEKLNNQTLEGSPFIFHTRWATHGVPNDINAHPHTDCTKSFYVVHNGIIENYVLLKDWLNSQAIRDKRKPMRTHNFISDTDTEVLAHLIEHFYYGNLLEAVQAALSMVHGTYGIAVISSHAPDELIAARLGSPLLIGVGDGENFVSSDPSGILAHTKKVIYLEENEIARIKADDIKILNRNLKKTPKIELIGWNMEEAQRGGYEHFMFKEIMEQPSSIEAAFRGRLMPREGNVKLGGLELVGDRLKEIKRLHVVGCGTAYYAGMLGKYMLEEYAGIPVQVDLGSEFRYRNPILNKKNSAFLCISQSGETADTLASLREAKNKGVLTLGIVNVVGSTIAREVDAGIYSHAGPEIGVASTKAFTSQLTALALLTIYLGRQRNMSYKTGAQIAEAIQNLPQLIAEVLKENDNIKQLAEKYKDSPSMYYLGRKYNYPVALEGALKIKEISYMHAEGYAGGEMKHGPIALIDENFPTFAVLPHDSVFEKMISNVQEIKARKGPIIALTTKGDKSVSAFADDVIYIPQTIEMLTPILAVIPIQLFAYYVGVMRGYDVDKPRNLAKSVTVE